MKDVSAYRERNRLLPAKLVGESLPSTPNFALTRLETLLEHSEQFARSGDTERFIESAYHLRSTIDVCPEIPTTVRLHALEQIGKDYHQLDLTSESADTFRELAKIVLREATNFREADDTESALRVLQAGLNSSHSFYDPEPVLLALINVDAAHLSVITGDRPQAELLSSVAVSYLEANKRELGDEARPFCQYVYMRAGMIQRSLEDFDLSEKYLELSVQYSDAPIYQVQLTKLMLAQAYFERSERQEEDRRLLLESGEKHEARLIRRRTKRLLNKSAEILDELVTQSDSHSTGLTHDHLSTAYQLQGDIAHLKQNHSAAVRCLENSMKHIVLHCEQGKDGTVEGSSILPLGALGTLAELGKKYLFAGKTRALQEASTELLDRADDFIRHAYKTDEPVDTDRLIQLDVGARVRLALALQMQDNCSDLTLSEIFGNILQPGHEGQESVAVKESLLSIEEVELTAENMRGAAELLENIRHLRYRLGALYSRTVDGAV